MKQFAAMTLVALAILGGATQTSATPAGGGISPVTAEFKVTGDLNKLADQLGQAVDRILALVGDRSGTVPAFAKQLSDLAGQQTAMARTLDSVADNPDLARTGRPGSAETLARLDQQMGDIQESITKLRSSYRKLDKQWAFRNLPLQSDIGGYAADGMIFYRSAAGNLAALTNKENTRKLSAELRAEAARVQALAVRMGQSKLN